MEPSGEDEQACSTDPRHERLESLRCHFERMRHPTPSQSELLKRNVKIVKGPRGGENGLSKSSASRHRQWQDAFSDIYHISGITGFYFVAHALSATALTGFVHQFQKWWPTASIPDAFVEHAKELEALHSVTQILGNRTLLALSDKRTRDEATEPTSAKRSRISTETDLHPASSVGPNPELLSPSERPSEAISSDTDSEDDEGTGEARAPPVDAPLGGPVYGLKRLDAISALVNARLPEIQLTIPNNPGVRPFITFKCTEIVARKLLTKRTQLM